MSSFSSDSESKKTKLDYKSLLEDPSTKEGKERQMLMLKKIIDDNISVHEMFNWNAKFELSLAKN